MTLIIDVLWLEYFFIFRVTTICGATIVIETNVHDKNDAQKKRRKGPFTLSESENEFKTEIADEA